MAITFSGGIKLPPGGGIRADVPVNAPAAPPITLPSSGNVLFHIDPSVSSSVILTGNNIDQINDQSSGGRNFTDGTSKPVYVTAGQNGLNTMDFSNATVGTHTAWLSSLGEASATLRHVFAVAKHDAATFSDFDGLVGCGLGCNTFAGNSGNSSWYDGTHSFAGYF